MSPIKRQGIAYCPPGSPVFYDWKSVASCIMKLSGQNDEVNDDDWVFG